MKVFLVLFGIALVVMGTLILPAVAAGVSVTAFISSQAGVCGLAGFCLAGGLASLLAVGVIIGHGPATPLPACPACAATLLGAWSCPACGRDTAPPRFALDTASLVGGIAALVCMGGAVGLVYARIDTRLVATAFLAGMCGGALALLMALCSLITERRRIGLAVAGLIIALCAVGCGVTLLVV